MEPERRAHRRGDQELARRAGAVPEAAGAGRAARGRRRAWARTRARWRPAETSLHAVRPELRGLAHARPPRRRLGRPPPQVAHGGRREGDALVGDDAVVDHALQLAAIHLHDCRRLRARGRTDTRRDCQCGQRAREKSVHSRNRCRSVVPFCAHTSPFACQHDRRGASGSPIEHALADNASYRPCRRGSCPSLQPNRRETRYAESNRQAVASGGAGTGVAWTNS